MPLSATLRVAYREFAGFANALARQVDAFRARRPGVEIELVPFEIHTLYERLVAGAECASGEWDVFLGNTDWLPSLIAEQRLRPLAGDEVPDWPDGWSASLRGLPHGPDGRLYGIPYHDGPEMFLYRGDLFEDPVERARFAEQHDYPLRPPVTWTEFRDIARFFTRPADELYGCVLAGMPDGHNNVYDFLIQLWSRGGTVFDDAGRPAFADETGIAALEYLAGLALTERVTQPDIRAYDSVLAGDCYAAGHAAMAWNWCGFAAVADLPTSAIRGRNRLALIPRGDGPAGRHVSLSVFWVMTIPIGARQPELAWDFLRHLAGPEMDRVTAVAGGIGCRLSTWRDAEIRAAFGCYELIEQTHSGACTMPAIPEYPLVNEVLNAEIDAVHTGRKTPREALADAARQTTEILR